MNHKYLNMKVKYFNRKCKQTISKIKFMKGISKYKNNNKKYSKIQIQ